MKILGKRGNNFSVENEEGMTWTVAGSILQNEAFSATQFTKEREVSRTEMVEALESAGDSVFTVVFDKKVSQKSIAQEITDLQADEEGFQTMSKRDINKLAKTLLAGTERRLVGYLASTEPKMGRSTVVDLEIATDKHRLRLVDHRTIKELVLRNVRYTLK